MIVYPPDNHQTDSSKIFFIGHADSFCTINNSEVFLYPTNNFCPVFDLDIGENIFEIKIDSNSFTKVVNRVNESPKQLSSWREAEPLKYNYHKGFRKICVDPGHGGSQNGTCSPRGILEKDLNLRLAQKIQTELSKQDLLSTISRNSDEDLALARRVEICKQEDCDLFVSVHHNAIPDHNDPKEFTGISVHYYYEHSLPFAQRLATNLAKGTGLESRGVIRQDLHVLRENPDRIAVLIEFGYLIHPLESEIICSEFFQDSAAKVLAETIKFSLAF